jgi:Protein of unknown function (DUF3592)
MLPDMSKSKKILVVGGAFLLGAVFVAMGWSELQDSRKLTADGKAVTAAVAGKYVKHGRKGRRSYYLNVGFKTESGAQTEQRVQVSSSQFEGASEGGSVPVHYLPANPSICQVGDKVETQWSGLLIGLGSWAVAAFLAFSKPQDDESGDNSAK